MGLTADEKKQLEALTKKSKEPDPPTPAVNFTLDLGSDTAWERAQQLGLVPGASNNDDDEDGDDDDDADDHPRRGHSYFGDK